MEKIYVVYRMESVGQYDYREDKPVFLTATKFESRAKAYQMMADKLKVPVLIEELEVDPHIISEAID